MSKDNDKNQEEKSGKMKRKEFEKELEKLQVELVKLQKELETDTVSATAGGRTREAAALGGTRGIAGDHRLRGP